MSKITELCGETPEGFEKIDISSNPNFVFDNDPTYEARQLFDEEGSKVFVNSFIECEHYVSGGWGYSPYINKEYQSINILTYLIILLLVITYSKSFFLKLIKK